jgi:hypothetical protein
MQALDFASDKYVIRVNTPFNQSLCWKISRIENLCLTLDAALNNTPRTLTQSFHKHFVIYYEVLSAKF